MPCAGRLAEASPPTPPAWSEYHSMHAPHGLLDALSWDHREGVRVNDGTCVCVCVCVRV